ncbi:hypothetical protein [Ferroacidibacillus organovorans]|uniref:Uncharacterized protein n=1 Tax=Ferroacidibacillus organovorans TaxID=1765683 RepID=A0A162S340_9BACL|nr:hypothetical protein [Ferroacidibacillus organovorans]KYP79478.1 hypothetical protein AYJ22_04205 [Ferroacidibacillus organovorans]OAG94528.1 hypothetical protein AYW79_04930 [Ferroacidibacillus organovorans]OPG15500.1 hypothetical protein B2M26_10450 [Ferroacidibacillus organovorans]
MITITLWFLIVLFLVPAIFQWLWNMTCPQIFRVSSIRYWQAFRLLILAALLFGGFHFGFRNPFIP